MVFFICNGCGESVKKAQAEKHKNICRNSTCLSCIDCGKDFQGESYKTHVKCISEDQKYGGKGYEAKANKGDLKQQQWIQKVHEAISKQNVNPKVRNILKQIESYDNVPRKKAKFQNWMKNSLKISNTDLQDQVWEVFSAAVNSESSNQQQASESMSADADSKEQLVSEHEPLECQSDKKEKHKKKNKKGKKELNFENKGFDHTEIKDKMHNVENGVSEKDDAESKTSAGDRHCEKKKKKRKRQDSQKQEDTEEMSEERVETSTVENMTEKTADESRETSVIEKKKKKHKKKMQLEDETAEERTEENASHKKNKKHRNKDHEDEPLVSQNLEDHDSSTVVEENEDRQQGKFNWKGTIKAVLKKAPDNELSIKKLKKKVLAQYYSVTGDANWRTENEVFSIFNKKIKSNPKFKVFKDKVKLAG